MLLYLLLSHLSYLVGPSGYIQQRSLLLLLLLFLQAGSPEGQALATKLTLACLGPEATYTAKKPTYLRYGAEGSL